MFFVFISRPMFLHDAPRASFVARDSITGMETRRADFTAIVTAVSVTAFAIFAAGVSRARRDEHGIGKTLRADGFRFCDGVDNFSSADIFYALVKAFRRAEACIGRVRRFAHHGNISQSFRSRASCARAFSNVQNDPHMAKASVGMSITTPPKYCRPPL